MEALIFSDPFLNEKSRKTKIQIINSYVSLLAEAPNEKPTVKTILEAAKVTRSTFYSYFDNVEDLSKCIIDEFVRCAEKCLLQVGEQGLLVEMLTKWFEFCQVNRWYYVTLSNARPKCFTGALVDVWKRHLDVMMDYDKIPKDMFRMMHSAYIPHSNEAMTYAWLTDVELGRMPAKFLAQIVNNQRINYVAQASVRSRNERAAFLSEKTDTITSEVVSLRRVQELLKTGGSDFLHAVFTKDEILRAEKSAASIHYYMQYYAAKRAVSACISGKVNEGMLREIAIVLNEEQDLEPVRVSLSGYAAKMAEENNMNRFRLSISHESEYAAAFVIATM